MHTGATGDLMRSLVLRGKERKPGAGPADAPTQKGRGSKEPRQEDKRPSPDKLGNA